MTLAKNIPTQRHEELISLCGKFILIRAFSCNPWMKKESGPRMTRIATKGE